MLRKFLIVLSVVTSATQLFAHSVWIEPMEEGQLVIRFAEPSGNLERSPGYLDSLSVPMSFILVTNTPVSVDVSKRKNHFLMEGASPTNFAFAETSFTVRAKRKPNFYARWQPDGLSAATPMLTLDLVPTGRPGEARAYFRGQPLGGIKATLHTPNGDELELVADADGIIRFKTPDSGQYMLTLAHHREPLIGFHGGVPYEQNSHNCSLVWVQSNGEADSKQAQAQ
ncbi:MAG TPA: hypothetical protein PKA41_15965 [Verrucomicrobiota bacterium]|nr:hypothetical protein [Verrucomicrobiota bacterium]